MRPKGNQSEDPMADIIKPREFVCIKDRGQRLGPFSAKRSFFEWHLRSTADRLEQCIEEARELPEDEGRRRYLETALRLIRHYRKPRPVDLRPRQLEMW
jgi:hypothetical protein